MKTSVIIIAVSQYYGNLINLPGTLNSAKRFADWAVKHGGVAADNILEITDSGDDPVTIRRVEQEVSDFLSSRTIDRLIIYYACLLYTSPSPRDQRGSRMPSSA